MQRNFLDEYPRNYKEFLLMGKDEKKMIFSPFLIMTYLDT